MHNVAASSYTETRRNAHVTLHSTVAIKFLLLLLLLMMATVDALAPITIRLAGNFGTAPATVRIAARVEPHTDNRVLCAIIANGEFETSSCRAHVGTKAPLQVVFEDFRGIGAGEYTALVSVTRQAPDGKVTTEQSKLQFHILSPFGG